LLIFATNKQLQNVFNLQLTSRFAGILSHYSYTHFITETLGRPLLFVLNTRIEAYSSEYYVSILIADSWHVITTRNEKLVPAFW